jgi:hypothetical protein
LCNSRVRPEIPHLADSVREILTVEYGRMEFLCWRVGCWMLSIFYNFKIIIFKGIANIDIKLIITLILFSEHRPDRFVSERLIFVKQLIEYFDESLRMVSSGMIRLVGKSVLAFCSICIIFSSLSFYEIYSEEKAILSTLRRWYSYSMLSYQLS